MKIGILTMPLGSNYGGTLQNYALQVVLKRLGYDSITLRFPTMYQHCTTFSSTILYINLLFRYIIKKALMKRVLPPLSPVKWKKNTENFEKFIQTHIVASDYVDKMSIDVCRDNAIDAIIVGSDQVWRPEIPFVIERYFCGFAKDTAIPRISYAASLALETWTFNSKQTNIIRELLQGFSHISVRENNGVTLLRQNANIQATWVVDPTMLLMKQDYLQLLKDRPRTKIKYIFLYILNPTVEKLHLANQIARNRNMEIRSLDDKALDPSASIEGWLSDFRDADYVVTDSFHGSVFSILFEKQFVCFENPHRGNARFDSLKLLTGLDGRFVRQCDSFLDEEINYSEVNVKVDQMRIESIGYLKKSLMAL